MKIRGLMFCLVGSSLISLVGCVTSPMATVSEDEETSTQGLVTTTRDATIRYAPSFAAPVVGHVAATTPLYWLGNQQRNGFYRVVTKEKGSSGWIRSTDVQVTQRVVLGGFQAAAACATTLDQCPENGCATPDSADGVSNALKHHVPEVSSALTLTFDDFAALQQQAGEAVGTGVHVSPESRASLRDLAVSGGWVSEGAAVRVLGYLTLDGTGPHPNSSGESVNCGLKGSASNDFHIPVTADPDSSEFDAIVVEMKPQDRPTNWIIAKLKAVQAKKQQVWIEGSLFYDSVHRVNEDSENPLGGQPKRFSLWEIHPVTKFLVCKKAACTDNESDWSQL